MNAAGTRVYVTNQTSRTVSVIDTTNNNALLSTITLSRDPTGVAVTADGSRVYVTNQVDNTVSVISTATNAVTTITISGPRGVATFG